MKYEVSTVFKGVDLMSGTIDKMQRKAKGFSHTLEGAFNNASIKLERMNSAIRGVTVSAAAWGAAYALPLASIYKSGAAVEDQLVRAFNKLDEKVPLGSTRFAQLQEQIAATTKGTEVFQVQAAEAFQELAGAGYDAEKSLGGLVNVYDAARFAQMGLGETAVRTVDAMKMFNLESKDAVTNTNNMRNALNMMAKADANSTTSMKQLYEAIQNGGAKAAEFGTDLATYLAMVTNFNSLKSFEAGTGAKQIFSRLIPTEETTKAIYRELKVDAADPKTGKMLDVLTIFKNLSDKLETKTEYERAQILKLVFGQEGTAPSIFAKEIKKLYPDIVKARDDYRANKADILRDYRLEQEKTGTGKWERFLKNFDDRKLKLFEPLKPKVIEAFDKAEAWMVKNTDKIVAVMTKMINYLPSIAGALLRIAENLPQIITVLGLLKITELTAKLLRGMAGLETYLKVFTTTGSAGNPITAIAALTVGIYALITYLDSIIPGNPVKSAGEWIGRNLADSGVDPKALIAGGIPGMLGMALGNAVAEASDIGPGMTRTREQAWQAEYNTPQVISSGGKGSVNTFRFYSETPGLKAEPMSADWNPPSGLKLVQSGGF